MSGAEWPVTLSDMLLALGILMLMFEVIKGARPGAKYLTDHLLSLIVFGAAAAEFVLWPQFGTSTYFLLTLLSLVDFLSGIALRARRGTVVAQRPRSRARARGSGSRNAGGRAAIRSRACTDSCAVAGSAAAATSVPAAASVAESVLPDHPAPTPAAARVASSAASPPAPSPEVPSPDLQPGNGTTPPDAPTLAALSVRFCEIRRFAAAPDDRSPDERDAGSRV